MSVVLTSASFNVDIYGFLVKPLVDNKHDLHFVCNRLASLYQEVEGAGCVDNLRVSKSNADGDWDAKFQEAIDHGCCGSTDREVCNPRTNNNFWIGFNYGH